MAIETLTGNAYVVHVKTGTDSTSGADIFEPVAYQRSASAESSREIIDASHKNSDHAQSVYGRQSGTFSLEGLQPDPAIGSINTHDTLVAAHDNAETVIVQRHIGSRVEQAEALVGTVSSEGPDNDVSTLSFEFTLQNRFAAVTA